jgi:hypothetical protein
MGFKEGNEEEPVHPQTRDFQRFAYRRQLASKLSGDLTTIKDISTAIEILEAYPECQFEDVTENTDLSGKIKDGMLTRPMLMANEGPFRTGRIYAPRAPIAKSIIKFESLLYDVEAEALSLITNTHEVALKRVVEVAVVFYQTVSRAAVDSSTTKAVNVYEAQVPNEPNRGTQSVSTTKVRLDTYGGTAAYYQKSFSDLYLCKGHEIQLTIDKVSSALIADAWITIMNE